MFLCISALKVLGLGHSEISLSFQACVKFISVNDHSVLQLKTYDQHILKCAGELL